MLEKIFLKKKKVRIAFMFISGEKLPVNTKLTLKEYLFESKYLTNLKNDVIFRGIIVSNKEILDGILTIKNTRISAKTISELFFETFEKCKDTKKTLDIILRNYPSLTKKDVVATLLYTV